MAGLFRKLTRFLFFPSEGERVAISSSTPEGLQLIFTSSNSVEADILRQVLDNAGFHVEFVPSSSTATSGMTGNREVYVAADETEAATAFLNEYLSSDNNKRREDE